MEQGGTRPLIIAHRGDSFNAPENTLAAFRAAIDVRADGVEFDVQLSKDGVPVVIHDATLKRTGRRRENVCDLTAAELAAVDVGSWFNEKHPKRARVEFARERVPMLVEALDLLAGVDGLIYIELKCPDMNFRPLAGAVASILRNSPLLPRVIVKSFRLAAVADIARSLPQVQTAALFEPSIMNILRRRKYIIDMAREFGAHQLSLHHSLVTSKLVSLAARANMPVTVWTVDKPKWIRRCRRLGIQALITNDPVKMLAVRNEVDKDDIG